MEICKSRVPRLSDTRYSAKGTKGEQQSKIEMRTYAISIYGYVRGRQI